MFDKQSEKRFLQASSYEKESALAIRLEIWLAQELHRLEMEYSDFVTTRSNRNFFKNQR